MDAFAGTCWYYGETLTDILGDPDLPLGLLLSSVGGTTIEQWSRAHAVGQCTGVHKNMTDYNLFNTMVAPFVNMSISTLLWYQVRLSLNVAPLRLGRCRYLGKVILCAALLVLMVQCCPSFRGNLFLQGENDLGVGTEPGNVVNHSGYACALLNTVQDWRALRSKSDLFVGVFGLAPGGSEGHQGQMAAFRISQTTSFGSLPSPVLDNSFFVPTHDLGDPCNKHSRSEACTGNGKYSYKCAKGQ
eukprot:COSAG02_NODE_12831_length_1486_cov_1.052632_2_plen_243_part_01